MTDSFVSYSEDFEQFRDDAAQDIRALGDASSKGARDELAERALGNISEAERYMRILESESRAGDSQERRRMHQQLRTYKSQIDKLKASLDRAKLMETAKQRQEPTNDPREVEARYQKRTDRIDDHLGDAQAIIEQTKATAVNITTNLQDQREHLINVRTNVDDTRADTREAGQHLKSLKCKTMSQILLLYFIIFGLCVFIIWKAISKFS